MCSALEDDSVEVSVSSLLGRSMSTAFSQTPGGRSSGESCARGGPPYSASLHASSGAERLLRGTARLFSVKSFEGPTPLPSSTWLAEIGALADKFQH